MGLKNTKIEDLESIESKILNNLLKCWVGKHLKMGGKNKMEKPTKCKKCKKEIPKHTHIEVRWGLSTLEGKSLLAHWFLCVECTTKELFRR